MFRYDPYGTKEEKSYRKEEREIETTRGGTNIIFAKFDTLHSLQRQLGRAKLDARSLIRE